MVHRGMILKGDRSLLTYWLPRIRGGSFTKTPCKQLLVHFNSQFSKKICSSFGGAKVLKNIFAAPKCVYFAKFSNLNHRSVHAASSRKSMGAFASIIYMKILKNCDEKSACDPYIWLQTSPRPVAENLYVKPPQ